ncbi:MAG: beta-propeller domain-containing protein [Candidatus Micrarchaeia archaeon]|jgi:uncharacterized secreted protein with C-terminal beta-propeller domain
MKGFAAFFVFAAIAIAFVALAGCVKQPGIGGNATITPSPAPAAANALQPSSEMRTFRSWTDVSRFIEASQALSNSYYGGFYRGGMVKSALPQMAIEADAAAGEGAGAPAPGGAGADFSTTNVQVEGVDEADILKNDGQYLYTVTNGQIVITKAYPAESLQVVATINASNQSGYYGYGGTTGIFVKGDKLVAFGSEQYDWAPIYKPLLEKENSLPAQSGQTGSAGVSSKIACIRYPCPSPDYYYPSNAAFMKVYDISDRANPKLEKTITLPGDYQNSRLIGGKVYAFFSEYINNNYPRPLYAVNGMVRDVAPTEIAYFDYPFDSFVFQTIIGLDLDDLGKPESRKVMLLGGSQNLFVSKENAYVTYTDYNYGRVYPKWPVYEKALDELLPEAVKEKLAAIDASDVPDWEKDALKAAYVQQMLAQLAEQLSTTPEPSPEESRERTIMHKFALGDETKYIGKGQVPGHVLNQFSMDEFEGNFRVATTTSAQWNGRGQETPSKNALYVLDANLKPLGKLEDLAPGEQIYSARFLGKRAYLVTFRQMDPLFAIGLDDPANPVVLGKLKIPGVSDYLHPYDETHLIGVGKEADEKTGRYAGMKISLFDVTDVSTPKEISTLPIGDRGTDSAALSDHKAFLFSKSRGVIVIPVLLAQIKPEKYPQGAAEWQYGEYTFQGAYVVNVSLENGLALRGTVSHADKETLDKSGQYYYGWGGTDVKRSAYINDVLYTISDKYIKANDISTLDAKAAVDLPKAPTPFSPGIEPMIVDSVLA